LLQIKTDKEKKQL
jgi:hypothetical protein